jgi:hypothetical protein
MLKAILCSSACGQAALPPSTNSILITFLSRTIWQPFESPLSRYTHLYSDELLIDYSKFGGFSFETSSEEQQDESPYLGILVEARDTILYLTSLSFLYSNLKKRIIYGE